MIHNLIEGLLSNYASKVNFIRQLALEMNARIEKADCVTPPLSPASDKIALEQAAKSADLESRYSNLQQTNDELRKQLTSSQNQVHLRFLKSSLFLT